MVKIEVFTLDLYQDLLPLVKQHARESSTLFKETRPNLEMYTKAQANGNLRVFVARQDPPMAPSPLDIMGYQFLLVGPHIHNTSKIVASETLLYLSPFYRGRGPEFMKICDDMLAREGVNFISRVVPARKKRDRFMRSIGYREIETTFVKEIPWKQQA